MIKTVIRMFGLLFVGGVLFIGGGLLIIIGVIFLWYTSPYNPDPFNAIEPLLNPVITIAVNPVAAIIAVIGITGFAWEIRLNGLALNEVKPYHVYLEEKRLEKARNTDAWKKPDGYTDDVDEYEELQKDYREDVQVARHGLTGTSPPTVRGIVRNNASRTQRGVHVKIKFLKGETVVDSVVATTKQIAGDSSWTFEVFYRGDTEFDEYRISALVVENVV